MAHYLSNLPPGCTMEMVEAFHGEGQRTPICPICEQEIKGYWDHDEQGDYFVTDSIHVDTATYEHEHCVRNKSAEFLSDYDRNELLLIYDAVKVLNGVGTGLRERIEKAFDHEIDLRDLVKKADRFMDVLEGGDSEDEPKWVTAERAKVTR